MIQREIASNFFCVKGRTGPGIEYRAALRIAEGQVSSEALIEMKLIRENIDMTKDNLMT